MLKTLSCLSETISFHFARRPLRATSVQVTAALASSPVSPRRLSKLRRGLPGSDKQQPSGVPIARPREIICEEDRIGLGLHPGTCFAGRRAERPAQ